MAVAGDGDFSGGGDLPSGSFAAFCTSNEKLTNSIGLKEEGKKYIIIWTISIKLTKSTGVQSREAAQKGTHIAG